MQVSRWTYSLGPFHLSSEIEVPELSRTAGDSVWTPRRPVHVRRAQVPAELPASIALGSSMKIAPQQHLLDIEGLARFLVRNGAEVLVELCDDNAVSMDVRSCLTGWVLGSLCHQNGFLPLHACAVARGEQVTAFLGDSGAGKSTLAAGLRRRGYSVVADDICLLVPIAGELRLAPIAYWLKLHRLTLEHGDIAYDTSERTFADEDKFRVYLDQPRLPAGLQLESLVFLHRLDDNAPGPGSKTHVSLEPVAAAGSLGRLLNLVYLGYAQVSPGEQARLFQQGAQLLNRARTYELRVPWGLERMNEVLDLLESGLLAPV